MTESPIEELKERWSRTSSPLAKQLLVELLLLLLLLASESSQDRGHHIR
jgi:hypothetical protein